MIHCRHFVIAAIILSLSRVLVFLLRYLLKIFKNLVGKTLILSFKIIFYVLLPSALDHLITSVVRLFRAYSLDGNLWFFLPLISDAKS